MARELIGVFYKNPNHPFGFAFYQVSSEDFETLNKEYTSSSHYLAVSTFRSSDSVLNALWELCRHSILHSFYKEAYVILIDNIPIKNRTGESISINDVTLKSGYFLFWDQKSQTLEYCSKSFERNQKIKKLFHNPSF